jgi:hypothetical protein
MHKYLIIGVQGSGQGIVPCRAALMRSLRVPITLLE